MEILGTVIILISAALEASSVHFHLDHDDLQEHFRLIKEHGGEKKIHRLQELRKKDKSEYLEKVFQNIKITQDNRLSKHIPHFESIEAFEGGVETDASIDALGDEHPSNHEEILHSKAPNNIAPYPYQRKFANPVKSSEEDYSDQVVKYIHKKKPQGRASQSKQNTSHPSESPGINKNGPK